MKGSARPYSPTEQCSIAVVLILSVPLLVASCTHNVHYRDVRVTRWSATTIPLTASESRETAEACIEECYFMAPIGSQSAIAVKRFYPSRLPHSDEDCRQYLSGSAYDPEHGGCVVELSVDYACLATCPGARVETRRCRPTDVPPVAQCLEVSQVVELEARQRGSCGEWYAARPTPEQPGVELACRDYVVREANPVGVVFAVLGILVLTTVIGMVIVGVVISRSDWELHWSSEDDSRACWTEPGCE